MEEKELIELIAKETEPLFKEQFINGAIAGWNACIVSILNEIKDIHNCKEVKRVIKNKYKERILNSNNDSNKEEV